MGNVTNTNFAHDSLAAAINVELERDFTNADPRLLTLVRLLVSENASIRNSIDTLRKELQDAHALADRDPLCPVFNRRAFMRELEREIARTERHGHALSLLFIDVDKFKQVNDTRGHEAGDQALIALARTLQKAVRKTDVISRIGGDEFAILLIETGIEPARTCALGLQKRIAKAELGISVSIGISNWKKGVTADELMANADKAMFVEKSKTKNAH